MQRCRLKPWGATLANLCSDESSARTLEMLRTAMGPVITDALDDPAVIAIMVNPAGPLWLDTLGQGRFDTNSRLEPDEAERVVRLVASHIHQDVTAFSPIVSAELPGNGERFEGVIPPVVTAPCFSIRKGCLLYTSPSPRDRTRSRMPSSA